MSDAERLAKWMSDLTRKKFFRDSETEWEGHNKEYQDKIIYVAQELLSHPPEILRKACRRVDSAAGNE